jgi:hypothetical protein
LARYFYPAEKALWKDFELEMRELKERTDARPLLPEQEARKRKREKADERKLFNISSFKHTLI